MSLVGLKIRPVVTYTASRCFSSYHVPPEKVPTRSPYERIITTGDYNKPITVTAYGKERTIACVCRNDVKFMTLKKGEISECKCGFQFELKDAPEIKDTVR